MSIIITDLVIIITIIIIILRLYLTSSSILKLALLIINDIVTAISNIQSHYITVLIALHDNYYNIIILPSPLNKHSVIVTE